MSKKQRIKEMAEDLRAAEKEASRTVLKETREFMKENHHYNSRLDYKMAHIKSCYELTAETLIDTGYRKVGGNEVIISKEDLKRREKNYKIGLGKSQSWVKKLKSDIEQLESENFNLQRSIDKVREETTKETILELLKRKEGVCDSFESCFDVVTVKNIKEFAEEHNIEVEE